MLNPIDMPFSGTPFTLKSIVFDLLLSLALLIVSAIITLYIVASLLDLEELVVFKSSIYAGMLIWCSLFYCIRRQFGIGITCLQIILSGIITYMGGYVLLRITDHLDIPNLTIFLICLILVSTKHASDKYLVTKILSKKS